MTKNKPVSRLCGILFNFDVSNSRAMQHVSGIMGSKYIVAINKDEAASIFDIADVGIVGDVKEILPLLIEEIKKRK